MQFRRKPFRIVKIHYICVSDNAVFTMKEKHTMSSNYDMELGVERPMTYEEARERVQGGGDLRDVVLWLQLGEWTEAQRDELSGLIQARLVRSDFDGYRPFEAVLSMVKAGMSVSLSYRGSFDWFSREEMEHASSGCGDGSIIVKVVRGAAREGVIENAAAGLLPGQMLLVVLYCGQPIDRVIMRASMGYSMPHSVYEDASTGTVGILFMRDYGVQSDRERSMVRMSFRDSRDVSSHDVPLRYATSGCRPKFYAMAWKKAEAVREKMAGYPGSSLVGMRNIDGSNKEKDSAVLTGGYYCIDWSHPGNADRGTGGDTAMKSCLRRVPATLPAGRYVTADAPCLIVDTDRLSVMEFRLPKSADRAGHPVLPFLLDSHALAYRLSDVGADVDPDRVHKAYRDAATRLDGRFVQWVSDLENMMSDVVGCHYHMSMSEKEYLLDMYGAEMLFDRKRLRRQEDKYAGVYLRPCGFDLVPYLEALDSRLLVKFVKTGEDRGYCRLTGADMSDAMLFSFIMNAMIAAEYNRLGMQERMRWDGRPWAQPDLAPSDKAPEWRRPRGGTKEFEYADTCRGESLKVWETRQMNAGYFASLFDVDANSLTKLKSTAIDKVKAGTGNRQLVIQAVNAVLRSRHDED